VDEMRSTSPSKWTWIPGSDGTDSFVENRFDGLTVVVPSARAQRTLKVLILLGHYVEPGRTMQRTA
jgi:hypothetical protein